MERPRVSDIAAKTSQRFACQKYMLTLYQSRRKKLRMFWLGSRRANRSHTDKRSWRSHRWRSHQTGPIRQQPVSVLSVCLTILGVTGDPARAENPILSACRIPPRAALGEIRKESPESKKAYTFILAATRFRFTGDYDHAIEQIDQAIKLGSRKPRLLRRARRRPSGEPPVKRSDGRLRSCHKPQSRFLRCFSPTSVALRKHEPIWPGPRGLRGSHQAVSR